MRRNVNQNTQPFLSTPVFQNWQVVADGWYFACRSKDLRAGQARSMSLCGQHVVLFRGEDEEVRVLDGFCPHMGTDLGIGKVRGNRIACFFHHWEFDGDGACQHVPCGEPAPQHARLHSYDATEKYGAIWVFPASEATFPIPGFTELAEQEATISFGRSYSRTCHHHVTMINGIDAQHLRTVHGFDIEMEMTISEPRSDLIDFSLVGRLPTRTLRERLTVKLLGPEYGYAMRYSAGTMGLLTMLRKVRLFNRFPLPTLHMIFAYRPVRFGETLVQPIYITRKRKGLWGRLTQCFLLWLTRRLFYSLKDDDGKVYDNMRFNPVSLLEIDQPIRMFINKINGLTPSMWSRTQSEEHSSLQD